MNERDTVFRERLVALMTDLNGPEGKERPLRRMVGAYAKRLYSEAGARDWTDLKGRADAKTYDSMLNLFQRESEKALRDDDKVSARAFEVLALSVIARRQQQDDLVRGIELLDKYITQCITLAERTRTGFVHVPAARGET
ncbi:MAG TPA: hypothetical protein VHZ56_07525 [Devosia sp.]|jgi:hypothetical protein|nr:hypothetical protein [Devosia sp.]